MSADSEHSNLAHQAREPEIDETVVMSDLFENYASNMAQYRSQHSRANRSIQPPDSLMHMRIRNGVVSRILTALGF